MLNNIIDELMLELFQPKSTLRVNIWSTITQGLSKLCLTKIYVANERLHKHQGKG